MTLALIVGTGINLLVKQRRMINHHHDQPKITKILGLLFQYIVLIAVIWWLMFFTYPYYKGFLSNNDSHNSHIYVYYCVCVCILCTHVYVCVYCIHVSVCCLVCVRVCVCKSVHICVECLLAWYVIPYMTERCINANQHYIKHTNGPLCVSHKPNHKLLTITRIKLYRSFHLLSLTS